MTRASSPQGVTGDNSESAAHQIPVDSPSQVMAGKKLHWHLEILQKNHGPQPDVGSPQPHGPNPGDITAKHASCGATLRAHPVANQISVRHSLASLDLEAGWCIQLSSAEVQLCLTMVCTVHNSA